MISLPSSVAVISVPPAILYVKSSPSISLADKLTFPDKSSSNDTSDTVASTGASFTPSTVTAKVCSEINSPSVTVAVNDSVPLKSDDEINVTIGPFISAKIFWPTLIEYSKSLLSISLADNNTTFVPPSCIVWSEIESNTGASLTGLTVTKIFCESVYSPSLTVTVNDSVPFQSSSITLNSIWLTTSEAIILSPPNIL